jgi:hypothetical protein
LATTGMFKDFLQYSSNIKGVAYLAPKGSYIESELDGAPVTYAMEVFLYLY